MESAIATVDMAKILPALCAATLARVDVLELAGAGTFSRPSFRHGRSMFAMLANGLTVAIKGCGWTLGPPWVHGSPKDAELIFGLLDEASALRELHVSAWLEQAGITAARCVASTRLLPEELKALGAKLDIQYRSGRQLQPSALMTVASSPYRVADLFSDAREPAMLDLRRTCPGSTPEQVLRCFGHRVCNSVLRYHRLAAVNDTLSSDNVVVSGEVTDFEWFYVPGIPLPDGTTDQCLEERQHKEGIYLAEVLLQVAIALDIGMSVSAMARLVLGWLAKESPPIGMPLITTLRDIASKDDSR